MSGWASNECINYYHIELPRQLAGSFWKLLTENYEVSLTRRQHSITGKDLNVELRIIGRKQEG